MNWLNLQVSVIRAPEYVGSEPMQRATWLNILAYSAEHENSGRIVGARKWKDRQWQQTCGVTLAEVQAAEMLLAWDGDDLLVWSYPTEREAEIKAKRDAGRRGGRKSGESRREAPAEAVDESREAQLEAELQAKRESASTERNRKGREGNEKEEEGGGKALALSADAVFPTEGEVVTFGAGTTPAIPESYCRDYHAKRSIKHEWLHYGRLIDWRKQVRFYWSKDKDTWAGLVERNAAAQPKKIRPPQTDE